MALRHERLGGVERVVDIGASYFTVSDPAFAAVVDGLARRGPRPPLDRHARGAAGRGGGRAAGAGPVRWAAPGGLRSLVEDLAAGLDVTSGYEVEQVDATPGDGAGGVAVDGEPAAGVVLAMPQPQAVGPAPGAAGRPARVSRRGWSGRRRSRCGPAGTRPWWRRARRRVRRRVRGVDRIADDGRRRGDGAPVLVVHSTPGVRRAVARRPRGRHRRACWPSSAACSGAAAPGVPRARLRPRAALVAGRARRPRTRARSRSTRTCRSASAATAGGRSRGSSRPGCRATALGETLAERLCG